MHTEGVNRPNGAKVVDIFSRRCIDETTNKVIRLAPELDGLEMLYTNDSAPDKLYSLKIVCWALREDGEVVGMVPWLNEIVPCTEIDDPLNGHWEGYRDPGIDDIFFIPPKHKIVELESSSEYYEYQTEFPDDVTQEIPDSIGTHAVLTSDGFQSFQLVELVSWQLKADGSICGMITDESREHQTPVLVGDECLISVEHNAEFKYYFQHRIANKIKERDPEALAAISMLIES
ncbi:MAG: hypothetical protein COB04_00285 [Gammaproteobacteria bacterium]|nr:MAG: hypothetical protein COB04_00285 [Gammaproteobacteria bacterium]